MFERMLLPLRPTHIREIPRFPVLITTILHLGRYTCNDGMISTHELVFVGWRIASERSGIRCIALVEDVLVATMTSVLVRHDGRIFVLLLEA